MTRHACCATRTAALPWTLVAAGVVFVAMAAPGASSTPQHRAALPATTLAVGINVDPSNPKGTPSAGAVGALGASWVRIEFKDTAPAGQPPSASALAFYKNATRAYSEPASGTRPISVLLILDYSSLPGHPSPSDGDDKWVAYNEAFAARCGAVVSAMGAGIAAVEVWNEPDLKTVGNVPAERFGPLLRAAATAIKAVSKVTVVMGGLASGDPSYVSDVAKSAGGPSFPADAIGIHPYGQRPTPDWPSPTWGFGVLTALLQRYAAVMPGVELWITEVGTQDMNAQSDFPAHTFDAVASELAPSGVCRHVLWFCWSDGMVSPFGVLDINGARKPSYASYVGWVHNQTASARQ